jgi:hypothetical protein
MHAHVRVEGLGFWIGLQMGKRVEGCVEGGDRGTPFLFLVLMKGWGSGLVCEWRN